MNLLRETPDKDGLVEDLLDNDLLLSLGRDQAYILYGLIDYPDLFRKVRAKIPTVDFISAFRRMTNSPYSQAPQCSHLDHLVEAGVTNDDLHHAFMFEKSLADNPELALWCLNQGFHFSVTDQRGHLNIQHLGEEWFIKIASKLMELDQRHWVTMKVLIQSRQLVVHALEINFINEEQLVAWLVPQGHREIIKDLGLEHIALMYHSSSSDEMYEPDDLEQILNDRSYLEEDRANREAENRYLEQAYLDYLEDIQLEETCSSDSR